MYESFNPFTPKSDLIDFTLSNARRFYSSKGDPLGVKGLRSYVLKASMIKCQSLSLTNTNDWSLIDPQLIFNQYSVNTLDDT